MQNFSFILLVPLLANYFSFSPLHCLNSQVLLNAEHVPCTHHKITMTLSNYIVLKNVRKLHIKVSLGIELYFNFRLETKNPRQYCITEGKRDLLLKHFCLSDHPSRRVTWTSARARTPPSRSSTRTGTQFINILVAEFPYCGLRIFSAFQSNFELISILLR